VERDVAEVEGLQGELFLHVPEFTCPVPVM
jgi:hypothetical protein